MEEKLVEYLEAFEAAAVQLGPQALDLAVQITRIESISYLVYGVGAIFLTIGAVLLTIKAMSKGNESSGYYSAGDSGIWFVIAFISGSVSIVAGIAVFANLFYIWNWVGVFAPEIRLARDILYNIGM